MKRTSKSGHYTPPPEVGAAAAATVGRLFAATAALRPDRIALVEGERSLTYAELDSRVNRLANALIRRGVGRGDRVALMARNCIGYIEVELACARIGAIAVGMNWRFTADETAHGLNLTGPSLVVASAEYEPVLKSAGFPADLVLGGDLEAAMAAAPRHRPRPPCRARGRHGHHLHQRHHGAPQGRDDQPPRDDRPHADLRRRARRAGRRHLRRLDAAVPHGGRTISRWRRCCAAAASW